MRYVSKKEHFQDEPPTHCDGQVWTEYINSSTTSLHLTNPRFGFRRVARSHLVLLMPGASRRCVCALQRARLTQAHSDPTDTRNTTALFHTEVSMWQSYAALLRNHTPQLVGHCVAPGKTPFLLVERVVEMWRAPRAIPGIWGDAKARARLVFDAVDLVDALSDAKLLWTDFRVANLGIKQRAKRPLLVAYDLSSLRREETFQPHCNRSTHCVREMTKNGWNM